VPPAPAFEVVLVGHPFEPTGVGEHLRAAFRGFRAVHARVGVHEVYGLGPEADPELKAEFHPYLTQALSPLLNIFHVNGNQIAEVFRRLRLPIPPGSYNAIWPMWELAKYPDEWARNIERFDEVWVASRFTEASIGAAVSRPVSRLPLGIEPRFSRFLGRRHFGIPETPFVFLFAFDFLSFIERKNPLAVVEAFRRLTRLRPASDVVLVIKVNNSEQRPVEHRRFLEGVAGHGDGVIVIDRTMTDDEIKNLIRCCDCFVSLHRAEGYGFPLGEAMYFGKPVIATAYSGNLEFMNEDNSCLVNSRLVPVNARSYPHGAGQVWADPDIDAAVDWMIKLVDDRRYSRALGERASRHVRTHFSYRAAGLCYAARVAEIRASTPATPTSTPSIPPRSPDADRKPPPAARP
jgi:glycosyltransferase involved in cell wall biosynthesis